MKALLTRTGGLGIILVPALAFAAIGLYTAATTSFAGTAPGRTDTASDVGPLIGPQELADTVDYFYDGSQFIDDKSWVDGISGGGDPNIRALNFYGGEPNNDGVTAFYLDDVMVLPQGAWDETVDGGGDAGELLGDAQVPTGTGPLTTITGSRDDDADMFLIRIVDDANFEAKTWPDSDRDTQLFLFDLDGNGVTFNDDDDPNGLLSRITGQFLPGPGDYYIALSSYDYDALSGGQEIWIDTPFGDERPPDGPGAPGPVDGWGGAAFSNGDYQIDLIGVEFPSVPGDCVGACCNDISGDCTDGVPQSDCQDAGDRWEFLESCGTLDPPCVRDERGACCRPDGGCEDDVLDDECAGEFDRFAANELCANFDPPCVEVLGACCIEGDDCVEVGPTECSARGGVFLGFGSTCDDDPPPCERSCGTDDVLWDNGLNANGVNARSMSPPQFPDIRVMDDFVVPEGHWSITGFHANVIEDAGWIPGSDIEVYLRDHDPDTGGPVEGLGNERIVVTRPFERTATGQQYFGRDDYDYCVLMADDTLDLNQGRYWIGFRNAAAGGSGTNYWTTSDGGEGTDRTGWFSLNAGDTFNDEGPTWHHGFEITGNLSVDQIGSCCVVGVGCLDDTTETQCEEGGGCWAGGSTDCDDDPCARCNGLSCLRDPDWLCDGDVDGDGQVNPVDAGLVQAQFGCSFGTGDCDCDNADLDCDGQVNPVDAGIVQSLFGTCELPRPLCADCNRNNIPDQLEIRNRTSEDCNLDGIPDECQDCNGNGMADQCDLEKGSSEDCNRNAVPDECEVDCNGNGVPDECDIEDGGFADCNENRIPDECEIGREARDCQDNGVPDACDIADGFSEDCDQNGVPDECQEDCNNSGFPDFCDIVDGRSQDCDGNGVPDECQTDCNNNGVPDNCDIRDGTSQDCQGNGGPDECDIAAGASSDVDNDGIPDECQPACTSPCDYWESADATDPLVSFMDFKNLPIMAGFFGDGSEAFADRVELVGQPLDASQFGTADTLVHRSEDPFQLSDPVGACVEVSIQLQALRLVSVEPISVNMPDGVVERWNVEVNLPDDPQPMGTLIATKTHPNGGVFDAILPVMPRFVFRRVGDPSDVLAFLATQPKPFKSEDVPWVHFLGKGLDVPHDKDSIFVAGIREDLNPAATQTRVPNYEEDPDGFHCVEPPGIKVNLEIFDGLDKACENAPPACGGEPVPEALEEKRGAVTVANLNDTDGDGHKDVDDPDGVEQLPPPDDVLGRDEVDLMKLVLHPVEGAEPNETMELSEISGKFKVWDDRTKGPPRHRRYVARNFPGR